MLDKRKIIGEFLVARGIISARELAEAGQPQENSALSPAEAIGRQAALHAGTLAELISEELGLCVQRTRPAVTPAAIQRLSANDARRFRCIPIAWRGAALGIAIDNPLHFLSADAISRIVGCPVAAELYSREIISDLLQEYYPATDGGAASGAAAAEREPAEDEGPVREMVSLLVSEACDKRASDIHIEPLAERLRIRVRVDGVLQEMQSPPRRWERSVVSRIKLMAGMNIAEKRLPQDGRFRTVVDERPVDLRVATLPAHHGESVVLRILDRRAMHIDELGFSPEQRRQFQAIISASHGIVLVTGPTGSGKSTTLSAVLSGIDRTRKKIITVEDPVEYQISGINQVQVKPGIGLTFARVMRSLLRQSPDVIMVGEIRDQETAAIAAQSALTGHVILSTLHTNDSAGAIPRLIDMGVPPYLIAATLRAVVAQRLLRLLCPLCRTAYAPGRDELRIMGLSTAEADKRLWRAAGCGKCGHRGYRGRSGIFELLEVDDAVRHMVHARAASPVIREQARQRGMMTLQEHARMKVLQGLTTFTELVRITQGESD